MTPKRRAHPTILAWLSAALLLLTTLSCDSISGLQADGSQLKPDLPHVSLTLELLEDGGVSLDGSWLLGGSISLFILIFVTIAGFEISGVMAPEFTHLNPMHLPYIAFALALIAMSVFQSRHVSRINLKLENQLEEVRNLSEKNLAHERSLRESEVRRVRLETEYRRTSTELEKARKLQLSLLPERFPPVQGNGRHSGTGRPPARNVTPASQDRPSPPLHVLRTAPRR